MIKFMDCISVEETLRLSDCQHCIDVASEQIQRECPLKKQAIICTQSFSWIDQVKGTPDSMFDNLTPKAANDRKYAESFDEITPLSLSQKLYGMVQCIPDLSAADCRACLKGARSVIPKSVPRECRVVHESCHLSYQFKNPDGGKMRAPTSIT